MGDNKYLKRYFQSLPQNITLKNTLEFINITATCIRKYNKVSQSLSQYFKYLKVPFKAGPYTH